MHGTSMLGVLMQMRGPAPQFVQEVPTPLPGTAKFDVVMCGGTLGIFLACALQLKGLRCCALHMSAAADPLKVLKARCFQPMLQPLCSTARCGIYMQLK